MRALFACRRAIPASCSRLESTSAGKKSRLAFLTAAEKKRLRTIEREYELVSHIDPLIPSRMRDEDWLHLLKLDDAHTRLCYLHFLKRSHDTKAMESKKKDARRIERASEMKEWDAQREEELSRLGFHYGRGDLASTILRPHVHSATFNIFDEARARHGIINGGLRVVFEMLHVTDNAPFANNLLGKQLRLALAWNRHQREPARVHFANCRLQLPEFADILSRHVLEFGLISKQKRVHPPISYEVSSKSISRLYPEETTGGRVVVINKLAESVLDGPLSEEDVYVIPGSITRGITDRPEDRDFVLRRALRQAQKNGFQSRALPLARYLTWQAGSKTIPLNNIFAILHTVFHNGGDWQAALQASIPARKWDPDFSPEQRELSRKRRQQISRHREWVLAETATL